MVSYAGKRSISHLTVRELDEAKTYGLTPESYDELREKLLSRNRVDVFESVKKEVTGNVEKSTRLALTKEIEASCWVKVEAAFDKDSKQKLEAKIREDIASEAPNPKDIAAFKDFAREIEMDSLAQAHAASDEADQSDKVTKRGWSLLSFACFTLFLGLPAVWHYANTYLSGITFILSCGVYVLAGLVYCFMQGSELTDKAKDVANLRSLSSNYWDHANTAKSIRMVDLPTARTRGDLQRKLGYLLDSKKSTDAKFHPSAVALAKARISVRDQFVDEMDPERLFESNPEPEARKQA